MRYITVLLKKLTFLLLIVLFFSTGSIANDLMGQEIFVAECVGCHRIKPPVEDESIADVLLHKAPSLRYAGTKFKSAFLLAWLQDPKPIRPLEYNSLTKANKGGHKSLKLTDAADVTRYLMTLQLLDSRPMKVDPLKIEPEVTLLAKMLFSQRYACYSCHQVRLEGDKAVTGGLSAPTLVGAGSRLNPSWVYTFLTDPREVLQRGSMPTYAGLISDEDLMELTKYIASFK